MITMQSTEQHLYFNILHTLWIVFIDHFITQSQGPLDLWCSENNQLIQTTESVENKGNNALSRIYVKPVDMYTHYIEVPSSVLLTRRLNLNSVNQLISVMVKCGVLFEVRTEFLNNI
jgi:hypothetical protein